MGNTFESLVYQDEPGDRYVYRLLRPSEDPYQGLQARAPDATDVTVSSHVHGKRMSPWISTTATKQAVEMFVALAEKKGFQKGVVVKINVSKLRRMRGDQVKVVDLTDPNEVDAYLKPNDKRGRNYVSKYKEVLIRGFIPAACVTIVEDCEDSEECDLDDYSSSSEDGDDTRDVGSTMTVFVMGLDGKTVTLQVRRSDTVAEVKVKLEDRVGIPACRQRLCYITKELIDEKTLDDYGVQTNSNFHLTIRLQGGNVARKLFK